MKVKEVMTARVVTVTPGTPVPVIAGLPRDNRRREYFNSKDY